LIILSHPKDGLEMAREHNIPKAIQDIMEQHHGTTLVKYFYYKLKNSSDKPEEIKEEDFRYPGPIPSTKESGIIMLADSVEAAVRSISEPTKGKIEEMVNNIINDKLNSRQLINCDLTLKDIETIRKNFLKTLDGIY
ncbi:HD domain-containing protein, partial [Clostridium perfringens]